MSPRARRTFLLLVVLQALHATEEYAARFYEVFPLERAAAGESHAPRFVS